MWRGVSSLEVWVSMCVCRGVCVWRGVSSLAVCVSMCVGGSSVGGSTSTPLPRFDAAISFSKPFDLTPRVVIVSVHTVRVAALPFPGL
jgi:hypothetical protein